MKIKANIDKLLELYNKLCSISTYVYDGPNRNNLPDEKDLKEFFLKYYNSPNINMNEIKKLYDTYNLKYNEKKSSLFTFFNDLQNKLKDKEYIKNIDIKKLNNNILKNTIYDIMSLQFKEYNLYKDKYNSLMTTWKNWEYNKNITIDVNPKKISVIDFLEALYNLVLLKNNENDKENYNEYITNASNMFNYIINRINNDIINNNKIKLQSISNELTFNYLKQFNDIIINQSKSSIINTLLNFKLQDKKITLSQLIINNKLKYKTIIDIFEYLMNTNDGYFTNKNSKVFINYIFNELSDLSNNNTEKITI